MPRLLVTMPARNSEATIGAAIGSVLRSLPADSILGIWDDGSTDSTPDIVQRVLDKRVRYWRAEQPLGSGPARQAVIDRCDSQYVANLDSDDLCMPWRFRRQLSILKTYDLTFSSTLKFSSWRRWRPSRPLTLTPRDSAISLLISNLLSHSSFAGRRSSLERAGGYRDVTYAQDYDLWLRAASTGERLFHSAIPVVAYRLSSAQVSRRADYARTVREDDKLRAAYLTLLEALTERGAFGVRPSSSPVGDPRDDPRPLAAWLDENIPVMSPSFRRYYLHVLRPLGVSWRESSWPLD